jgi:hypothetical protein
MVVNVYQPIEIGIGCGCVVSVGLSVKCDSEGTGIAHKCSMNTIVQYIRSRYNTIYNPFRSKIFKKITAEKKNFGSKTTTIYLSLGLP